MKRDRDDQQRQHGGMRQRSEGQSIQQRSQGRDQHEGRHRLRTQRGGLHHQHQNSSRHGQHNTPDERRHPVNRRAALPAPGLDRQGCSSKHQQKPERGWRAARMEHGHRQRAKRHELPLRDEDDSCHRKNQYQRDSHQAIHRTVDQSVLRKQQGYLRIHSRLSL